MLTTMATFGTDGDYPWTQFWTDLRANDVVVVDSWDTAYYTNFSGSSGKGAQPIVLSYASSPPAEVIFSEGKYTEPPTANFLIPGASFRQIEFAGILKGTQNQELAQKWIDYMLSTRFQEDMPLQMFVYPVNADATLPTEFQQWAPIPPDPATLPADEIARTVMRGSRNGPVSCSNDPQTTIMVVDRGRRAARVPSAVLFLSARSDPAA